MSSPTNLALPAGYQLQDYEIRKVLSSGGFSFVYLARDQDKKTVAIKEYLPSSIALRNNGATVLPNSDDVALFRHGLKCFFDEGLSLAKIDHVHRIIGAKKIKHADDIFMVNFCER